MIFQDLKNLVIIICGFLSKYDIIQLINYDTFSVYTKNTPL